MLCRSECESDEERYAGAVKSWSGATPASLGVAPKFHERVEQDVRSDSTGFIKAVSCLQQVAAETSAVDKVTRIRDACREMQADPTAATGADELLPLLVWCMIQAKVPHLVSEMKFMTEMLIPELCDDDLPYFLSCGN